jgi:hypothetical protein
VQNAAGWKMDGKWMDAEIVLFSSLMADGIVTEFPVTAAEYFREYCYMPISITCGAASILHYII